MQPAWNKQKLCWANYALNANAATLEGNLLGGGYTNDECWTACGTTNGCIGYQINYNNGNCYLVSQWDRGNLIYANTGMPAIATGVNIYAMGDYNCPDKNVVVNYF